jgi:DNA-binding PadR family transcriptional regulator
VSALTYPQRLAVRNGSLHDWKPLPGGVFSTTMRALERRGLVEFRMGMWTGGDRYRLTVAGEAERVASG